MADTRLDEAPPATLSVMGVVVPPTALPSGVERARRLTWRHIRAGGVAVVVAFLGLNGSPWRSPFSDFVRSHPWSLPLCILAACGVLSFLILDWPVNLTAKLGGIKESLTPARRTALLIAVLLVTSMLSTAVVLSAVGAAIRPEWCPAFICSPPALPAATGPHDDNIEVRFTGFAAQAFVLQGDIASINLDNLPHPDDEHAVAAQSVNAGSPYSIALHLRNLSTARVPLLIKGVTIRVDEAGDVPSSLSVWTGGEQVQYGINPVQVTYGGELPGSGVSGDLSNRANVGSLLLASGESDELDVRVLSVVPVDLSFHLAVLYQTADGSAMKSLRFPSRFHVVFADSTRWLPYTEQNGQLVPTSIDGGSVG